MSIINYYNSPTVINWNLDQNGQQVSLPIQNETKQVVDGKIPLEGLPDEQYRVQITGYVEINIKDKIDSPDKFKCDYTHGILYFDQSKNGTSINIDKYYSRGQFYIPASRVWTRINDFGEVVETLEDITDTINNLENRISVGNTLKTDLDNKISTATTRRNELDGKISTAIEKRDELDNRISLSEITVGNVTNAQQILEDMIADIDGSDPFTQKFIAAANQDTFTLTLGKYKNIDMILVYIQGVLLEPLVDFTTIGDGSFNKIKISEKLPLGTEVIIKVLQTVPVWAGTTILP